MWKIVFLSVLGGKGLFRVMQLEIGLIEYKYGDRGARYLMGDNLIFFDRVFKVRLSSFALDEQYLRVATSRVKTSAPGFVLLAEVCLWWQGYQFQKLIHTKVYVQH
jgi:hypothetical protein